ncbi:nucleoside phosphorylase [Ornithobacterium rhinotracheale]|uniref:Uridine phosphorylase n=2 Tax=Ornithobacterium rhinotracheale TaxID=28251 RepID=I4A0I7_ORNRL|nr:nucleoside phosphorylase [Ornithobacterium rhinotracheale]AFL97471.1 uridine phosphorylase [Ornithobacterium rhinotracheale DSM 15997]AIP98987.1 phosphorylase [Ornithobacterium rhinotracheale ORT-UMN 88]KGB66919.1 phosphorylase [Ornithobacterium rhinotracheale H06-030791]MBN3661964.1 phosphorylase [Ornithobacterium rhinotracheale]MCK0195162.1 nucleoside phosphorylase [Ornithobacterium rhinotracheale]
MIKASELPLNPDGGVYHLNLLPEDIADTIILVGDPERVARVSKFFDEVEIQKHKREFVTHTGTKNGKRLTVLSSGIGTDNIDIVVNELDALVNVDLKTREIKENKKSLRLVRFGTSGTVNPSIKAGDFVASRYTAGFDGLMNFYPQHQNSQFQEKFLKDFKYDSIRPMVYTSECDADLLELFRDHVVVGNTGSMSGFYGPQGRQVRLQSLDNDFLDHLHACGLDNFEMETSAIYSFAKMLGHHALSLNCIIANRTTGEFLESYKESVDQMIELGLNILTK